MGGILFDTSVYISALRQGDTAVLSLRRTARAGETYTRPLWLSMVGWKSFMWAHWINGHVRCLRA